MEGKEQKHKQRHQMLLYKKINYYITPARQSSITIDWFQKYSLLMHNKIMIQSLIFPLLFIDNIQFTIQIYHLIQQLLSGIQIIMIVKEPILFKIILLGQQGVGKSSLLTRYIKNQFTEQYNVTLGVQFASKSLTVNDYPIKLQIWDTSGQQIYRTIARSFYRGVSGVLLLYSFDNYESFESLKFWSQEVKESANLQILYFLVACRTQQQSNRKVKKQQAKQFLQKIGGTFFLETSSKNGKNIFELFEKVAQTMYNQFIQNGRFRNLVQPAIASGYNSSIHGDLILETNNSVKRCC